MPPVVGVLGNLDGNELSELTHHEAPWTETRGDCGDADRCSSVITNEAIRSFCPSPSAETSSLIDLIGCCTGFGVILC